MRYMVDCRMTSGDADTLRAAIAQARELVRLTPGATADVWLVRRRPPIGLFLVRTVGQDGRTHRV